MAVARVTGVLGAVALLTGMNADFNRWSLSANHPVDDDTAYGDTLVGASHSGSGCVDYGWDAGGFLKRSAATTAPGIGLNSGVAIADLDGAAITLTAFTGCTFGGTGIVTSANIAHAKRSGAIPVSYAGVFDGDVTETWAVS
jgi:hypothetical protein